MSRTCTCLSLRLRYNVHTEYPDSLIALVSGLAACSHWCLGSTPDNMYETCIAIPRDTSAGKMARPKPAWAAGYWAASSITLAVAQAG